MNFTANQKEPRSTRNTILIAGLAGGVVEILWVALYSIFTQTSGGEVARQVAASVLPSLASGALAVTAGITIHLALSLALAALFAAVIWLPYAMQRGAAVTLAGAVIALVGVWAVNFFIILPVLNPAFVVLMPYAATLFSKLLFGVFMAWTLNGFARVTIGGRTIIRLDSATGKAAL